MTKFIDDNLNYDESYIIFGEYTYSVPNTQHIEFPILVNSPPVLSSHYYINLDISIRPELKDSTFRYEYSCVCLSNKYYIPYFAIKLDNLPHILFIFLLYPEDHYFKDKFKDLLLPSIFVNFYDIDNDESLGNAKLESLPNWFDICSKLTDNKYLTYSTFDGLVHKFSTQVLVNYFYTTYF